MICSAHLLVDSCTSALCGREFTSCELLAAREAMALATKHNYRGKTGWKNFDVKARLTC